MSGSRGVAVHGRASRGAARLRCGADLSARARFRRRAGANASADGPHLHLDERPPVSNAKSGSGRSAQRRTARGRRKSRQGAAVAARCARRAAAQSHRYAAARPFGGQPASAEGAAQARAWCEGASAGRFDRAAAPFARRPGARRSRAAPISQSHLQGGVRGALVESGAAGGMANRGRPFRGCDRSRARRLLVSRVRASSVRAHSHGASRGLCPSGVGVSESAPPSRLRKSSRRTVHRSARAPRRGRSIVRRHRCYRKRAAHRARARRPRGSAARGLLVAPVAVGPARRAAQRRAALRAAGAADGSRARCTRRADRRRLSAARAQLRRLADAAAVRGGLGRAAPRGNRRRTARAGARPGAAGGGATAGDAGGDVQRARIPSAATRDPRRELRIGRGVRARARRAACEHWRVARHARGTERRASERDHSADRVRVATFVHRGRCVTACGLGG